MNRRSCEVVAVFLLSGFAAAQTVQTSQGLKFSPPAFAVTDAAFLTQAQSALETVVLQGKLGGHCRHPEVVGWRNLGLADLVSDLNTQFRALGAHTDTLTYGDANNLYFKSTRGASVDIGAVLVNGPSLALFLCQVSAAPQAVAPAPLQTAPVQPPPAVRKATAAPVSGVKISAPAQVRAGQPFTVHLSGLPGNPQDWVTVTEAGLSDDHYGEYFYSHGRREGDFTFKLPLTAGPYEVRVYFDYPAGGNTVRARQTLTVSGAVPAQTTAPATNGTVSNGTAANAPASLPAGKYECVLYVYTITGVATSTLVPQYAVDVPLGRGGYGYTYTSASGKFRFTSGPFSGIEGDVTTGKTGRPTLHFYAARGGLEECSLR